MKRIALLGSTGSIGTQTLDVVAAHPDKFEIEVLTANNNVELLIKQAQLFKPNVVVVANELKYERLKDALKDEPIKVYAGSEAIAQVVQMSNIDVVLTALVGYAGLNPTIQAIEAGKSVALANKETLVIAGDLVTRIAKEKGVCIYPVDSEHSAIFQCLAGEFQNPIEKIYLTCSGGPFRGMTLKQLEKVTLEDALCHPNWSMGAKVTVDSATLMNKGFEVIEAKWLFDLKASQIDVVVHPQSIVHSLVQFCDGSIKAQMGLPDMRLPIQYALSFPERFSTNYPRFNFLDYPSLSFEQPDIKSFKCLNIAYEALAKGGNVACVLNAANEVAVQSFLRKEIRFVDIPKVIEGVLEKSTFVPTPSLDDYVSTDRECRRIAEQLIVEQA